MFAICIESSPARGMGHFYRALNLIEALDKENIPFVVFINDNKVAKGLLERAGIEHETVPLGDHESKWEQELIEKYSVDVWIDDRLNTSCQHALNVKSCGCLLVTFDDRGTGARMADINIVAFAFDHEELPGKKVLKGIDYLVLNKSIDACRRQRIKLDRVLVAMGGSDTYGITVEVVKVLRKQGISATIICGPSFAFHRELNEVLDKTFICLESVPSLIEVFCEHDLAITAGGITPFEAAASGLPPVIVAAEPFEVPNAQYLDRIGAAHYAGYRDQFDLSIFDHNINLEQMSACGMQQLDTNGVNRIISEIKGL